MSRSEGGKAVEGRWNRWGCLSASTENRVPVVLVVSPRKGEFKINHYTLDFSRPGKVGGKEEILGSIFCVTALRQIMLLLVTG